jgi:hypothetical protein
MPNKTNELYLEDDESFVVVESTMIEREFN